MFQVLQKTKRQSKRHNKAALDSRSRVLRHETLEDRSMLATINVTVSIDGPINTNNGTVTLREAIAYINRDATPGTLDIAAGSINGPFGVNDTIKFLPSIGGQTIGLTDGPLTLNKPALVDGLASQSNGKVAISGGDAQSGIYYNGDDRGLIAEFTNLEFRNFVGDGAIIVESLGNNDSIYIRNSKFTAIGLAGTSDVPAIDIRDGHNGLGTILVEDNEIYNNDIGVKMAYAEESNSTIRARIGGNQFQNPSASLGNRVVSIESDLNVKNVNIENNHFFTNSNEVAIRINQPDTFSAGLSSRVIVDEFNTFGTNVQPDSGDQLNVIEDNRTASAARLVPELNQGDVKSKSPWEIGFTQENFNFPNADYLVTFYEYDPLIKRWSRFSNELIPKSLFNPSGTSSVFVERSFPNLSPGTFIAARAFPKNQLDNTTIEGSSAFSQVMEVRDDPPMITDVLVRGTSWDSDTDSYSLGDTIANGEQLRPIWYEGIDTIDIVVSESLSNLSSNDIRVIGSTGEITPASISPDPDGDIRTHDYRWTLPTPLARDKYRLVVESTEFQGELGDALNGFWDNPITPDDRTDDVPKDFVTGTPGGSEDFRLHFAVLPGDYDGDGTVEANEDGGNLDATGDGIPDNPDAVNTIGARLPLLTFDADFNDDEIVNKQDFDILLANFNSQSALPEEGDATGDGIVDLSDFGIWQTRLGNRSAWFQDTSTIATIVAGSAPRVTSVMISDSSSTNSPHDFSSSLGTGEQLRSVPVSGADTISIQFSEGVFLESSDLQVTNLDSTSSPTISSFGYDYDLQIATWTFASDLSDGRHLFVLSDVPMDMDQEYLDGELENPWSLTDTSPSVASSGNGEAGGDFRFRATILANDTDRDNIDGTTDYTNWHAVEPGMILASNTTDEDDSDHSYGDVSLREAIILANAATEPTTIVLPTGRYSLTRTGTEAGDASYNDLDVTGDVTIVGDGAGFSIIDSTALTGSDGRALHLNTATAKLRLDRLTIANGASASNGQGVYVQSGDSLEIYDSAIVNHEGWAGGSGVAATDADVTILRSVFTHNDNTSPNPGATGAALAVSATTSGGASLTLGQTIFAYNVQANGTQHAVWAGTHVTKTNEGYNLYDTAAGGFFNTTPGTGDHLGTPDYVVTSLADTFDHADDDEALSLREAIDLANTTSGAEEIWIPAWHFELTRDRGTNVYDTDVSYGDLDIKDDLTVRGVDGANGSATSVAWKSGITDAVFDLLGDFTGDGITSADDGDVDSDDHLLWQQQNGSGSQDSSNWGLYSADADDDGDVDNYDLDIWLTYETNTLDIFDIVA